MDQLQKELDAEGHPIEIRILGINGIGLESGNATITAGRTLPWLQDVAEVDVWTSWAVTYRDVRILDTENRLIGVYNLTEHNLGEPANYAELKAMLTAAAGN